MAVVLVLVRRCLLYPAITIKETRDNQQDQPQQHRRLKCHCHPVLTLAFHHHQRIPKVPVTTKDSCWAGGPWPLRSRKRPRKPWKKPRSS